MAYLEYIGASVLAYAIYCSFWYFPIFYKKKRNFGPRRSRAESIAHRGSREEGLPENTVAAYRDAVVAGTDIVELDVWLTTDGKVVVHHDDTLSRMTCGRCEKKICEMNYAEIPLIIPTSVQSRRTELYKRKECLTIPLFEEALDSVPSPTCLIIEFKQNSNALIAEVLRILNEKDRKGDVFWFSLDEKINKKLRAADASIPSITSIPAWYVEGTCPVLHWTTAFYGNRKCSVWYHCRSGKYLGLIEVLL